MRARNGRGGRRVVRCINDLIFTYMENMQYSGDIHDICCISLTPVCELEHPVGFDSQHAFECDDIVLWITQCQNTNPLTLEHLEPTHVTNLLRPLIINNVTEHIAKTQTILNEAGWVIIPETKTVTHEFLETAVVIDEMSIPEQSWDRRYLFCMSLNTVIYLMLTYLLVLSKFHDMLGQANTTLSGVLTLGGSFLHLVYETCKKYPVNGSWIMFNYFITGSVVVTLIEALEICSPGEKYLAKCLVIYGAILTSRVTFDIHRACGMKLQ